MRQQHLALLDMLQGARQRIDLEDALQGLSESIRVAREVFSGPCLENELRQVEPERALQPVRERLLEPGEPSESRKPSERPAAADRDHRDGKCQPIRRGQSLPGDMNGRLQQRVDERVGNQQRK